MKGVVKKECRCVFVNSWHMLLVTSSINGNKTMPISFCSVSLDMQQRRRVYEDLAKQQARVAAQMCGPGHVPILKIPQSKSSPGQQMKRKPKGKPDSLIQKLLDRFDPPRLRNS